MPTMKQKVDRIEAARQAQIAAVNTKDETANLPLDTSIEDIAPAILAIPTGGQENLFLTETDLKYMFYNRNLADSKVLDGLKRFSQNNVTNVLHTFSYAVCTNKVIYPEVLEYIKDILTNTTITEMRNLFESFESPSYSTAPQEIPFLDLSNLNITGYADNAFKNAFTSANNYIKIKFKKDSFKNCHSLPYIFQYLGINAILILEDNELDISTSTNNSNMFNNFKGYIEDYNGNISYSINLKMNQSSGYSLSNAFGSTNFERINFDNTLKCNSFQNAFSQSTNLKSITGLNFSSVSTSGSFNPFGNTALNYFGELEIINGSTLGTLNNRILDIHAIWKDNKSAIRDGQTIEYWYEKFANALGNKAATGTQTITISSALYNSLTQAQIELITNKGYILASA